jgi:membrane protein
MAVTSPSSKSKVTLKGLWQLLKATYERWYNHDPFVLSAALSYYAIFSLPALIIVVISTSGFLFGKEAVSGELYRQINNLIGKEGALQIQDMVAKASLSKDSWQATVISIITILFSATAVFTQLQNSLNLIWGVKVTPQKAWLNYIISRTFSFGMVAMLGFLLLVSLVVDSVLSAFYHWIIGHLSFVSALVIYLINNLVSLGMFTLFFGVIFKVLPDVKMRWSNVWIGSLFTALLFTLGKLCISYYLSQANPGSTYGAAGSVIVILLWVSYSSLILFFGAVFTHEYSQRFGVGLKPNAFAEQKPVLVEKE